MGDEKTASAAPLWGEFMTSSGPNHFFTAKSPRAPSFQSKKKPFFPSLPWRLGGPTLFFDMKNFSPPSRQERQVF
jgi:hypothetical protein